MPPIASPMSPVTTHENPRLDRATKHGAPKSTLECLIVSTDINRRELLSQAATDNGWSAIVCADSGAACRLADRIAFKLAIIDMERSSPADLGGLLELSAELGRADGPLLVLCGAEGDVQQEIWARQLGAWLYLSGLAEAEADALAVLCGEARFVVEKKSLSASAL
jgi:ActR/RegA family two-component response regulator